MLASHLGFRPFAELRFFHDVYRIAWSVLAHSFVRVSNSSSLSPFRSFAISNSSTSTENSFGLWFIANTTNENSQRHWVCMLLKKHKAIAMKPPAYCANPRVTLLDASGSLVLLMALEQQVSNVVEVVFLSSESTLVVNYSNDGTNVVWVEPSNCPKKKAKILYKEIQQF